MSVENWIQLLVPAVGLLIAVISASLSYFFTKRSQLRADESRLKEKYYLDYIKALSHNVLPGDESETRSKLSDAHNHILLIGSSDVVAKLRAFSNLIAINNEKGFTLDEHDAALTALIKSMRNDLYKKRNINENYPVISLSGSVSRHRNRNE